jgi:hypothetical protein
MRAMIDDGTTLSIRAPRYAEVGQSEMAPAPRRTVGRPFPRTQNGVELVPMGLLEDAIDPRTEDPDAEMAELQPRDYAAIYAEAIRCPRDQAEIDARLTLMEQHVSPGIPLATILQAADLLGIGTHYDLLHFLSTNEVDQVARR